MREPDKSSKSTWWRVRSACTALKRDRDGSALFYTTLALPVLVGFAVLAIDGARLMNLNSTLQHAADGLALAAAGELDRKPDACVRAVRALTNLVENDQMFGELGAATITIDDVEWTFLSELPANDWDPIPASMVVDPCDDADDAALVRYIEVWVKPQNFNTLFPASFLGGSNTARTNAVAVAGFDAVVCEFTPLFICNPWDEPITEVIASGENIGKQIKFHMVPPGCDDCTATPGNFGLLETPTSGKNKDIKEMLATKSPGACFIQNEVHTKPGISGVGDWLNIRFDLFENDAAQVLKNKQNYPEAEYRPAANVRKGYKGDTCGKLEPANPNAVPPDPITKLGRDSNFTGFIGDGNWDFDTYWDNNFPSVPKNGWSNALNRPTRYEVYQYELENYETLVKGGTEIGAPLCRSPETSIDRRIIYAAVIDCEPEGSVKGKHTGQAEAFVEMFLTEPADQEAASGPETIWVEITDLVDPGADTIARDRVQLYR